MAGVDMVVRQTVIRPQDGFQVQFLSSEADIVIGGAMAGVGKSWCLQVAPLRHKDVERFNAICFRRESVQIRNPGGLWDKSQEVYPMWGFKPNEQQMEWTKKKMGITVKFSGLQHEKDIYNHDGSEYCLIEFDELQHFTKKMFFYLLSRNRSTCGVRPYVLASCNPDPDSFLAEMLEWWIDQDEYLSKDTLINGQLFSAGSKNPNWGFPIPERIGVIRYMILFDDKFIWGNSKEELVAANPDIFSNPDLNQNFDPHDLIKSVTFISGSIYDNQVLLQSNPQYLANLFALDEVEKLRLLYGNWKVRSVDDCIFKPEALSNLFDNQTPDTGTSKDRFITVDAARFGDDLCTIFVWQGWKVIKLVIMTKSGQPEIVSEIEKLRKEFNITRTNCIIDQDGVGGGVVKMGKYIGFSGADKPIVEPRTGIKENYKDRNTQFGYRFAEAMNDGLIQFDLNSGNVFVDSYPGLKVKLKGTTYDVRELIKQDCKAIRKANPDMEGKKRLNSKIEQKRILRGRSPDFYDGSKLRVYFDLKHGRSAIGTAVIPGNLRKKTVGSLLDRI